MKQKLLFSLFFIITNLCAFGQVANAPTPLQICDDSIPDGIAIFDLTIKNAEVLGSQNSNDFFVMYYGTQMDADANMNPLTNPYTNTLNPQTVYVRVEELNTGVFDTTTLDLVVNQSPIVFTPAPLEYCDDDNDGFGAFTLTDADIEITGGTPGYTVSYYETMIDAQNNVNMLPSIYNNILANTQTLYARGENASSTSGCASFVELQLVVNASPIATTVNDYIICELNSNGSANFDLESKTQEILNGQDSSVFTVTYHVSQADADMGQNTIPGFYTNVSNPQTIYANITNVNTDCSVTSVNFNIEVQVAAEANPDGSLLLLKGCDDNVDFDNNTANDITSFNLNFLKNSVLDGQDPVNNTVSYFYNQADADANVNALPLDYTNVINPQVIVARVSYNGSICYDTATATLEVFVTPTVTLDSEYSFCVGQSVIIDSGFDGSTGNYSFDWYKNGIYMSEETGPTLTVVMADFYELVVVDASTWCDSELTSFIVTEVSCVDSDSDGVTDTDEDINGNGNLDDDDTDGDTIPNYLDDDDDGDNVPTIDETTIVSGRTAQHAFVDTDNDLIENYLDDDDDGDGILTITEDYNTNGDPTDDDTDVSGTPDYLEANVALSTTGFNTIDFAFYPNPATSVLNIKLNNALSGNATVEIIDIQGKTVISTTINQTLQLDVRNLMSGLYFLKLKNENNQTVKKLIIE